MRASALGSVLVMLGASGQRTKMKAGEPIADEARHGGESSGVMAPLASTMGEDVVTAESLPSRARAELPPPAGPPTWSPV
jgi:hypothetical protein